MELITKLSGLLKAITYTIRVMVSWFVKFFKNFILNLALIIFVDIKGISI